jgi:hypothetical protein
MNKTACIDAGYHLQPRCVLEAVVSLYLTPRRRDDSGTACPLAALASDLPRASDEVLMVAPAGVDRFIATIQKSMDDSPAGDAFEGCAEVCFGLV